MIYVKNINFTTLSMYTERMCGLSSCYWFNSSVVWATRKLKPAAVAVSWTQSMCSELQTELDLKRKECSPLVWPEMPPQSTRTLLSTTRAHKGGKEQDIGLCQHQAGSNDWYVIPSWLAHTVFEISSKWTFVFSVNKHSFHIFSFLVYSYVS